jgi:hypothetical protein
MSWPEAFFGAACVAALAWIVVQALKLPPPKAGLPYSLPLSRVVQSPWPWGRTSAERSAKIRESSEKAVRAMQKKV